MLRTFPLVIIAGSRAGSESRGWLLFAMAIEFQQKPREKFVGGKRKRAGWVMGLRSLAELAARESAKLWISFRLMRCFYARHLPEWLRQWRSELHVVLLPLPPRSLVLDSRLSIIIIIKSLATRATVNRSLRERSARLLLLIAPFVGSYSWISNIRRQLISHMARNALLPPWLHLNRTLWIKN